MNIHHDPIFDVEKVVDFYSKKDGVPVKYVCTSAINEHATFACDVFYRDTPHPEFGNRYFGLYHNGMHMMIANADSIERLSFTMIEGSDEWHYSQHRHDFRSVPGTGVAIDGGRAYVRLVGDGYDKYKSCDMKVKDGTFVEVT